MIKDTLYHSASAEWETPQDLFNQLDREFHFTLDACATPENAKVQKFFTAEDDGLMQSWGARPYGAIPLMAGRSQSGSGRRGRKG